MKNKSILRSGLLSSALLLLLLLLTLSLTVGCVSEDDSVGTDTDTETETPAETEAETETSLSDLPAADALNQIFANMEADTSESDNGKLDLDLTMGISVSIDGMQNTTSMPIKLAIALDGDNIQFSGNLVGETVDMIYVDGMLYMTSYGESLRCAMTPEEFASVVNMMLGDGEDETEGDLSVDIPELEGMKIADIFASVTSEVDPTNGDLLITAKGINESLSSTLAPLLQPMLESMGLVGGELDENGELITDPAVTLAQVVSILRTLNEETATVTFVVDKTGKLLSVSMDMTMTVEQDYEGSTMISTFQLKGTLAITEGNVTVSAPANAADYLEEDWRTVFGMETAEMLALIPDEAGVITLSDDSDLRASQLSYIDQHYEEYLNTQIFRVAGIFEASEPYEDGSAAACIYLLDAAGEPAFESMVSFTVLPEQSLALEDYLPTEATRATVTFHVATVTQYDFEYTALIIETIGK